VTVPSETAATSRPPKALEKRAELAGGWLRVESAPDEGTRVESWIPDAPASADESKDEEAA
jgi:signal transduction histidine kinase